MWFSWQIDPEVGKEEECEWGAVSENTMGRQCMGVHGDGDIVYRTSLCFVLDT